MEEMGAWHLDQFRPLLEVIHTYYTRSSRSRHLIRPTSSSKFHSLQFLGRRSLRWWHSSAGTTENSAVNGKGQDIVDLLHSWQEPPRDRPLIWFDKFICLKDHYICKDLERGNSRFMGLVGSILGDGRDEIPPYHDFLADGVADEGEQGGDGALRACRVTKTPRCTAVG